MKKIILLMVLFMSMPTLAQCPTDKSAKWLDGKCYTCEQIKEKLPELDGKSESVHISNNTSEAEVEQGLKKMDEAFEIFGLMMQLAEACPEMAGKEE